MEVSVGGADEGLRCVKISAGGLWKCNMLAMRGEVLCEKHYFSAHRRLRDDGDGGGNSGVGGGGDSDVDCGGQKRKCKAGDEELGALPVNGSGIEMVFGVSGVRKRGRPKSLKNEEVKKVVEGSGGGFGSEKRGRPKGSKNRKKIGVKNEDEAMRVDPLGGGGILSMNNGDGAVSGAGQVVDTVDVFSSEAIKMVFGENGVSDVRKRGRPKSLKKEEVRKVVEGNGGGFGSGKMGRPKGSKNRKKIGVKNEAEALRVDPLGGGEILSMNNGDGAVSGAGQVVDTVDVFSSEAIKMVFGENGVNGVRKRGRPKSLKNEEVKKVVEGNGSGFGSEKRGRPKGSKNKKKIGVKNEAEAMRGDPRGGGEILSMNNGDGAVSGASQVVATVDVFSSKEIKMVFGENGVSGERKRVRPKSFKNEEVKKDVEGNGGGFGSEKSRRPKSSKNRKKIGVKNKAEDGDVSGTGQVGLNENVTKNMYEAMFQKFNDLRIGGCMSGKDNGERQPEVLKNTNEVSMVNDNQETLLHFSEGDSASCGNTGTDDAPVLKVRRMGRPKGSKNKKKAVNQTKKIGHIRGNVSRGNPAIIAALMQKVRRRGRPKGSKNKKKSILIEKSDGIDEDVSCVKSGLIPAPLQIVRHIGRPKGSKNKKKKTIARPRNNEPYNLASMGKKILDGNVETNNESCDSQCMRERIPYHISRRNKSSALGMPVSFFIYSSISNYYERK